jgi:hypothetical protein
LKAFDLPPQDSGLCPRARIRIPTLVALLFISIAGCQKVQRTSDPQLQPIQEMLDTRLPPGSTQAKVATYLNTQGYPIEPSEKPGTIVAVIRKIDVQRMEPITARATFYFDATGRLNTFELQRMLNQPVQ